MGGGIVSMIWYDLTNIGGTRPESLFYVQWYNKFLRVRVRRIFLDVNPDFFWEVVDSPNKQKYHDS